MDPIEKAQALYGDKDLGTENHFAAFREIMFLLLSNRPWSKFMSIPIFVCVTLA